MLTDRLKIWHQNTPRTTTLKLTESFESVPHVNSLIQGDNLEVLNHLASTLSGKIDLIYIDPPFATQNTFRTSENQSATISSPRNGNIAYSDVFTLSEYIDFISERVAASRDLLSNIGSFYIHTDVKVGHYVKVMMDEIFGRENFRNEITRIKCNPKNFQRRGYGNIKDTILFYTKGADYIWNHPKIHPPKEAILKRYNKVDANGRRYTTSPLHAPGDTVNGPTGEEWRGIKPSAGKHWRYSPQELDNLDQRGLIEWSSTGNPRKIIYADEAISKGVKMQDVWEFKDPQHTEYPTEKNLQMLETIVAASSNANSVVLDFFCGSGTTLMAADNLGRKWIGIDDSEIAIAKCKERIQDIQYCFRL